MPERNAENAALRERVTDLRDGAKIRVGLMSGENAATMRGWIAACDEVLELIDGQVRDV